MKVFMIIIALLLSNDISGKRSHQSSSDEGSIENILYYKDKKARIPPQPVLFRTERVVTQAPQPVCPCPKMCCTICCECSDSNSMFGRIQAQMPGMGVRQMQTIAGPPMNGIGPMGQQMGPPMGRKKPNFSQAPQSGRRSNAITRQNIKSLIAQDNDIKKILKDLVKVTIEKVELQASQDAKRAGDKNYTGGSFTAEKLKNAVTEVINNYNREMEIYDDDPGGMVLE